ncbi:MAG: histidinol phosphate phosphatase domain-containing protein [Candidatus Mariimomonas ferrooxydans]
MIDLHTHSLFSDGVLLPSELARRAYSVGYKVLAITDHVDSSNIDFVVPRIVKAAGDIGRYSKLTLIPGAEITHVPPELIRRLVTEARELGAKLVIVHGETVTEPVIKGTNRAAIEAGADMIAHPGLISRDDVMTAKKKGVVLEITSRKGHSISNGYVAKTAAEIGADLIINTDSHSPEDLITVDLARIVLRSAGIPEGAIGKIFENSKKLAKKICKESRR